MKKYHRSIVFTKVPMKSSFRYKDVFQIFPAQLEKLPFSKLQAHYPNILEYWTDSEEIVKVPEAFKGLEDLFSLAATTLTKQDKIMAILSVISNHMFFRYSDGTGCWGIPMLKEDPGEEANTWSSKWCMSYFHFPELPDQLKIESFSKQNLPATTMVPEMEYYLYDPNIDFDSKKEISFPDSIVHILDSYYSLAPDILPVIDTAISHCVSAMEMRQSKKTLSLLAAFTSLETMVNLEFRDVEAEKCETCGQLRYSVARKFREFLLKYVGKGDKNKRKFNSYYSLRSNIIHTGRQLKSEKLFSEVSKEESESEFIKQIEILQITKLAIIKWIGYNHEVREATGSIRREPSLKSTLIRRVFRYFKE
jgi:hypothetical protein